MIRLATLSLLALIATGCSSTGSIFEVSADEDLWAIRCGSVNGVDRQRVAKSYAEQLKKVNGLKPDLVMVLDQDNQAVIFYGRYRRFYDREHQRDWFEPDHLRDMDLIRNLSVGGRDNWPFLMAVLEPLRTHSELNPAWNFENVDGYWSLSVAVFYDTETMRGRRYAAEEYCKMLRGEGQEAYFHHGDANSSVYVGLFPKEALSETREQSRITGEIISRTKIVDPRMIELQKKFPYIMHNGYVYSEVERDTTGAVKKSLPYPSFPVMTPKATKLDKSKGKDLTTPPSKRNPWDH